MFGNAHDLRKRFSGWLDKATLLIFLAHLDALTLVVLLEANLLSLPFVQFFAGLFAFLFPVGWLLTIVLFPKHEQLSLVARVLLSLALSVAISNLSLAALYYLPVFVPLNVYTNSGVLAFWATIFFGLWLSRRVISDAA